MNVVSETAKPEENVSVTVTVNGHVVIFHTRKANGAEIKAAAIAQGVPIQQDFALFEVKGPGHLDQVPDDKDVELHPKQAFRAVAPDDNSESPVR
jgi:hypothetical protein